MSKYGIKRVEGATVHATNGRSVPTICFQVIHEPSRYVADGGVPFPQSLGTLVESYRRGAALTLAAKFDRYFETTGLRWELEVQEQRKAAVRDKWQKDQAEALLKRNAGPMLTALLALHANPTDAEARRQAESVIALATEQHVPAV